MRPRTTIIADDLTGALDAAVQFRTRSEISVTVDLNGAPRSIADVCAHVVPTRDATEDEAVRLAHAALGHYDGGGRTFKKIDSMLRGHWAMEVLLLASRPGFDRILLAPAAPRLGRTTRDGMQHGPDGRPVADIVGALRRRAAPDVVTWSPGVDLPVRSRIVVCDARTDADLAELVSRARELPGRGLWCGSAGLAGALAGGQPLQHEFAHLRTPRLAIVGTNHPVTAAQLADVAARSPERIHPLPAGSDTAPPGDAVHFPDLPPGAETAEIARRLARLLPNLPEPGCCLVTGGETLQTMCRLIGATHLAVEGEVDPGVVVSTLHSQLWGETQIVSKSGGFGRASLLSAFLGCGSAPVRGSPVAG